PAPNLLGGPRWGAIGLEWMRRVRRMARAQQAIGASNCRFRPGVIASGPVARPRLPQPSAGASGALRRSAAYRLPGKSAQHDAGQATAVSRNDRVVWRDLAVGHLHLGRLDDFKDGHIG